MPRKKTEKGNVTAVRPASGKDDARVWLRENGYDDIADKIDYLMMQWKSDGKRTRRNWWEILAGQIGGQPRRAGGTTFPVLRAARLRQGLSDVPDSISRNPYEQAPPIRVGRRWPKNRGSDALRVVTSERETVRRIRRAVESGRIPPLFRAADVNEALRIHWAGTFLRKHRVGNPGGMTELFVQARRGVYRLK